MTAPETFARLSAGLADAVRAHDALTGLVLLGSSSNAAAHRRDDWSDHDFFVYVRPGEERTVRDGLADWLPEPERLAFTATEGDVGRVAVYDDGHVFEFAVATPAELAGALAEEAEVAVDDAQGTTAAAVAAAQARGATQADAGDAANSARLVLVKLLIGVGRARRGEVLNAGMFVRSWAVEHLVRVIRLRVPAEHGRPWQGAIDPVRRVERDHPALAARIAAALEQPVEDAARSLYDLLREVAEPGWADFPTRGADAVAARLGWR